MSSSIPNQVTLIKLLSLLPTAIYFWATHFSIENRCIALILSFGFMFVETIFTGCTRERVIATKTSKTKDEKTGKMMIIEEKKTVFEIYPHMKGHTTWAQFFSNVLYLPIFLAIREYVKTSCVASSFAQEQIILILLFPFNIWLLEIIEGYALIFIFGRNLAWHYDSSDALFHGNIRLKYFPAWHALGAVVELLLWDGVIVSYLMNQIVSTSYVVEAVVLTCLPISYLSDRFVGWPQLSL